jgi:hypothetical protein
MTENIQRYRRLAVVRAEQLADDEDTLRRWLVSVRTFGCPCSSWL